MMTPRNDDPTRVEQLRRRGLFAYHDGYRDRIADVIQVQLRIQDKLPGGDMAILDGLLEALADQPTDEIAAVAQSETEATNEPSPTGPPLNNAATMARLKAMSRLADLVGAGFDLPPLDESTGAGLSIQERVDLLADFLTTAPALDEGESATDEPAGVDPATPSDQSATAA